MSPYSFRYDNKHWMLYVELITIRYLLRGHCSRLGKLDPPYCPGKVKQTSYYSKMNTEPVIDITHLNKTINKK